MKVKFPIPPNVFVRYIVGFFLIALTVVSLTTLVVEMVEMPPRSVFEDAALLTLVILTIGASVAGVVGSLLFLFATRGVWPCLLAYALIQLLVGYGVIGVGARGFWASIFDLQRELEWKLGWYLAVGILVAMIFRIFRRFRLGTLVQPLVRRRSVLVSATCLAGISAGLVLFVMVCYGQGARHNRLGRTTDAITSLKKAYQLAPQWAPVLTALGWAYLHDGSYEQAIWYLNRALKFSPRFWPAKVNMALLYVSHQRWADAFEVYQEVLAIRPSDSAVALSLAGAYLKLGQLNEAALWVERARRSKKAGDTDYIDLMIGQIAIQQGNLKLAEGYFQKLARREQFEWAACNYLGEIRRVSGRYEEAVALFKKALEKAPDSRMTKATIVSSLGDALAAQGQLDAASESYQKALRWFPQLVTAYNGLAYCANQRQDFALAIQYLNRALELDPYFVELHYRLGLAYLAKADQLIGQENHRGDRDDLLVMGAEFLKRTITASPSSHPDARYYLARAYLSRGLISPGLSTLHEQLKLYPDHTSAIELHHWLAARFIPAVHNLPGQVVHNAEMEMLEEALLLRALSRPTGDRAEMSPSPHAALAKVA